MFTVKLPAFIDVPDFSQFKNISCLRLRTLDVARDVIKKGFKNISCLRLSHSIRHSYATRLLFKNISCLRLR